MVMMQFSKKYLVVLYVTYFKRKIMMRHLIFLVGMYEISDGHVDIKIYRL